LLWLFDSAVFYWGNTLPVYVSKSCQTALIAECLCVITPHAEASLASKGIFGTANSLIHLVRVIVAASLLGS